MNLLKKIFGELLPISELHGIQDRLSNYGVELQLPRLFSQGTKLCEGDVLNLIEEQIVRNNYTMVHSLSGCGAGTNADTIGYIPRYRINIKNGVNVVLWLTYRMKPESTSYLEVQFQQAKSKLNPRLVDHTIKALLLADRLSVRFDADYSAFLSLATLYLSKHSELQGITVDQFADHAHNASRAEYFRKYLGASHLKDTDYEFFQHYAETFVLGDTINSRELTKHRAVINALCLSLDCLQDRTSYRTYRDIENRVYKAMIQEMGKEPRGFWVKCHLVAGSDNLHSFPFAYLCPGCSKTPIGNQLISEGQRVFLHPFIEGVHYGFVVTVTANGWTMN